jgi:hypothetical protein
LAIVDSSPHVSSNILFQVGSEGSSVKVDENGDLYANAIKGFTNVTIKSNHQYYSRPTENNKWNIRL